MGPWSHVTSVLVRKGEKIHIQVGRSPWLWRRRQWKMCLEAKDLQRLPAMSEAKRRIQNCLFTAAFKESILMQKPWIRTHFCCLNSSYLQSFLTVAFRNECIMLFIMAGRYKQPNIHPPENMEINGRIFIQWKTTQLWKWMNYSLTYQHRRCLYSFSRLIEILTTPWGDPFPVLPPPCKW